MRFSDALDRKAESIERPPVLPLGHYVFVVKAIPEMEDFESAKTGDTFDRVTFMLSSLSAGDDVDEEELAAYGNPSGQTLRKAFLFNTTEGKGSDFERSLYNMKMFLVEHLGLDESMTIQEQLASCVGAQCMGEVTHRADPNNSEIVYAEIGRTTAV